MRVEKLGSGVFTIEDFLSSGECDSYIDLSENYRYETATINAITGPQINKEIRYNDRVIVDDINIANVLYIRAKDLLPKICDNW